MKQLIDYNKISTYKNHSTKLNSQFHNSNYDIFLAIISLTWLTLSGV